MPREGAHVLGRFEGYLLLHETGRDGQRCAPSTLHQSATPNPTPSCPYPHTPAPISVSSCNRLCPRCTCHLHHRQHHPAPFNRRGTGCRLHCTNAVASSASGPGHALMPFAEAMRGGLMRCWPVLRGETPNVCDLFSGTWASVVAAHVSVRVPWQSTCAASCAVLQDHASRLPPPAAVYGSTVCVGAVFIINSSCMLVYPDVF